MPRTLFQAALLLVAALSAGCSPSEKATAKPGVPLTVTLSALNEAAPGEVIRLRAVIETRVNAEHLTLRIEPPQGFSFLDGTAQWQGSLSAGATRTLEVELVVPETSRHTVIATGTLRFQGGRFSARDSYTVGPAATTKSPAGGVEIRRRDGVVEYGAE